MNKLVFKQEIYTFQIDFAHHVSNIVYIEWMEIGRLKLLEHIGLPVDKLEEKNITPILIHTEINYKKALYIKDTVTIEVWISKLRNASAVLSFDFFNAKREHVASGKQIGLFMNLSSKKPVRLGKEERKAFESMLIDESFISEKI